MLVPLPAQELQTECRGQILLRPALSNASSLCCPWAGTWPRLGLSPKAVGCGSRSFLKRLFAWLRRRLPDSFLLSLNKLPALLCQYAQCITALSIDIRFILAAPFQDDGVKATLPNPLRCSDCVCAACHGRRNFLHLHLVQVIVMLE